MVLEMISGRFSSGLRLSITLYPVGHVIFTSIRRSSIKSMPENIIPCFSHHFTNFWQISSSFGVREQILADPPWHIFANMLPVFGVLRSAPTILLPTVRTLLSPRLMFGRNS